MTCINARDDEDDEDDEDDDDDANKEDALCTHIL